MVNVCIVEDEMSDVSRIREGLLMFGKKSGTEFLPVVYECADALIKQYVPGSFDIIFLDILLPGMNGMDAAKKLRERDNEVLIIFVTNEKRLAVEGYLVDALDYLVKPIEKFPFFTTMDRALLRLNRSRSVNIEVRTKGGLRYLNAREIIYVEVLNHTLIYHTGNEDIIEWAALKKAKKLLAQYGFENCSSSLLVNLRYVTEVSGSSVVVAGETFKITRSKKQNFIDRLNSFYAI